MIEKLKFKSNNYLLSGIISNPSKDYNKPIIILCHGSKSNKNAYSYTQFETTLNNSQISTFRFDFFGHGESEGKYENLTLSQSTEDIRNAIEILLKKGYRNISLLGTSYGGTACIVVASNTKILKSLILISPVTDSIKISEIITQCKLEIIKNADHAYSRPEDFTKRKEIVKNFILTINPL